MAESIPVTLKWNGKVFSLTLHIGEPTSAFKGRVQDLTGVPVARQKLLAKKGWKGALKDDVLFDTSMIKGDPKSLTITLIGSAETLEGPKEKVTFLEDLSPEEVRAAEDAQAQAAMANAQGMIQALQLPPHHRDDHKQEVYRYNRLVTGLPQRQIEQELKHGDGRIQGKVAMNLGLELRRSYINALAVLEGDGSLVSVMDDGHVQVWKHALQQQDSVHPGSNGGVDSIVSFSRNLAPAAFATAGRGSLQLWTADAEPVANFPAMLPGTSPASLQSVFGMNNDKNVCLAARFQITRQSNPMQFRLPPQNDAERQRRALAEAQEQAIQQELTKAARCIQVWYSTSVEAARQFFSLRSKVLEPPAGWEESAPITCLGTLTIPETQGSRWLVSGDAFGGLRVWRVFYDSVSRIPHFVHQGIYQLQSPTGSSSIVCLASLSSGRLAVSTDSSNIFQPLNGSTSIPISSSRAVYVVDFTQGRPQVQATLTAHQTDSALCMCALPNGDLLTGGGKLDATLQLWSSSQLSEGVREHASKTLADVGYVFCLTVLPDAKEDSSYYAVAAGRYNTVKIII